MPTESKARTCPRCGSRRVVPIEYGYPGTEAVRREGRREVFLGGCMPSPPAWHCWACEYDWPRSA